jgi:site-specific DNA-cytosine methylase
MRKRKIVTMGYACDVDKSCQQVLLSTYGKGRCVFQDILQWTDGNCFVKTAPCSTHGKRCHLPTARASSKDFDTSGPNCQMFSKSGKQKGMNDKRWKVHQAWAKHRVQRQEPACVLENVPDYCDEHLPELLENKYNVHSARFCPSQFGVCAARPRYYGLLLHKDRGEPNGTRVTGGT